MWRTFGIGLLLVGFCAAADAGTYYIATDGKPENDGSREKPWPSVEFALAKVSSGSRIVLRPGVDRGPIQISKAYAGTEQSPTIIQSEEKWKAVIIDAPVHCIVSGDGCHWLTVDGFEVLGARYDGIKLNGDHNVVRNCWVHHNTQMGIAMHHVLNGTIENNLIEFNGCHVQFDHGVYADGDGLTVRGNIVRHNAAFGLHLYPSLRDWNCGRAIVADIIPFKGRLPLYWATRDPALKIQMQGVAAAPLESDFARDKWTQFNLDGPILKPELPWEGQCIEAAAMAEHSGRPYMFDAGNNDQGRSWYLSAMPVDWKEGMPVLAEDKLPRG